METKPKINFNTDQLAGPEVRMGLHSYHDRTELIADSILTMMLEKTLMYGGNNSAATFQQKIFRAYYEGIGRKSDRLQGIMDRLIKNEKDEDARKELLDTYIDVVGYGLLAINALAEELQGE
jgi:hypothetical protein